MYFPAFKDRAILLYITLQRFNGFAAPGVDDYPKDFEPASYPTMSPIDSRDMYAIVLRPSALDTCSGPFTDGTTSQLQYKNGTSVPGVYSFGSAACFITHDFYMAPGIPSFSGVTQAYRAAKDIHMH
jgi:hypothetical protein